MPAMEGETPSRAVFFRGHRRQHRSLRSATIFRPSGNVRRLFLQRTERGAGNGSQERYRRFCSYGSTGKTSFSWDSPFCLRVRAVGGY